MRTEITIEELGDYRRLQVLARTLSDWKRLEAKAEHDPNAVSAEQLSHAWSRMLEALAEWELSR